MTIVITKDETVQGQEITIISPETPLANAVLGAREGEKKTFTVKGANATIRTNTVLVVAIIP